MLIRFAPLQQFFFAPEYRWLRCSGDSLHDRVTLIDMRYVTEWDLIHSALACAVMRSLPGSLFCGPDRGCHIEKRTGDTGYLALLQSAMSLN